jgi:hypothetical protein
MLIIAVLEGEKCTDDRTRVAFRGAFGPHEGIVLETDDNVVLAVENREESNFRPLPSEILSSLLGLNRTRTGISTTGDGLCRYRRWKRAISAPSAPAVRWLACPTILNWGSESEGCA